jgi:hypothetical protein
MDEIQTTEADFETMEAQAPKAKKAAKKPVKTVSSSTEQARDRVKAKLAAANRPNKDDMIARLGHDN